jgi:hypothetical protein
MIRYQHTQIGHLIIALIGIGLFAMGYALAATPFNWISCLVAAILLGCMVLFASLTVIIKQETLEIKFGPGIIHKTFSLKEISHCRTVRNHWFYGWGIRLTPHGWLFNVSGLDAVEIQLRTGKKYRIGTDDPAGLAKAVQESISG